MAVTVEGPVTADQRAELRDALQALPPWRKGPFSLFGVDIDTEWRSDWKGRRVMPHLEAEEAAGSEAAFASSAALAAAAAV